MTTPSVKADVRTVVFDIGGVFIDWNPRHLYRTLIADAAAMEHFLATVCTPAWNLEQDRGRDWDAAVAELTQRHPDQAELIAAYHLRWDDMVSGPIDGTAAVLDDLRARGVPCYAITNFSVAKLKRAQERFPELTRFDGIIVSGEVGLVKPDPAIFHRLFDTYGLAAAEAIFIDDVLANVQAAQAVGMHGHHFIDAPTLRSSLGALGLL